LSSSLLSAAPTATSVTAARGSSVRRATRLELAPLVKVFVSPQAFEYASALAIAAAAGKLAEELSQECEMPAAQVKMELFG